MSIFKKIESYHEKTIFCEIMGKLNRLSHNKNRQALLGTQMCSMASQDWMRLDEATNWIWIRL